MRIFGYTDKGLVRPKNEDAFGYKIKEDGSILALVCDGIGGNNAGDVASKYAVDTILADFEQAKSLLTSHDAITWIRKEVQLCNDKIYRLSCSRKEYFGMGTTLVGAFIHKDTTLIINVGDSRAYGLFDKLICLTEDHNLLQELLHSGQLSEKEAVNNSTKHVLTNALGVYNKVKVDIGLVKDDYEKLLLCSDGLHGYVSEDVIESVLLKDKPIEEAAELLIQAALIEGGYDNTTVLILDKEEGR